MYAVIMAGGQGTRLWPKSRKKLPKQLQKLVSDKSLIRETVDRLLPIVPASRIYISTTPEYEVPIRAQLPMIPKENYVVEPFANGNAAACTLVTATIHRRDQSAEIIFLPADHAIKDIEAYQETVGFAENLIRQYPDHIITIGLKPFRPDTGLGYIHLGEAIATGSNREAFHIERFVEKPDYDTAVDYVQSGEYLWNSGAFLWRADHFLGLVKEHLPQVYGVIDGIMKAPSIQFRQRLIQDYGKAENTTVDYGIMEKTRDLLVIPGEFGWSDIGSWGTLFELLSESSEGNVVSRGHHIGIDDANCLVMAGDKLVATVGLEDVVVVDTDDAILICNRHKAHQVKDVLSKLKEMKKEEYL